MRVEIRVIHQNSNGCPAPQMSKFNSYEEFTKWIQKSTMEYHQEVRIMSLTVSTTPDYTGYATNGGQNE